MIKRTIPALFIAMATAFLAVSCQKQSARTKPQLRPPEQDTEVRALAPNSSPALKAIIDGAVDQIGKTTSYDPSYQKLEYPNGDVPMETGVCSDVIIRAFRKANVDLQKDVHEDMKTGFAAYPTRWGLKAPDSNIDHRRVPNLMTFFTRKGKSTTLLSADSFLPGDVVTWDLGGGYDHIGMVTNVWYKPTQHYLVVHNIGNNGTHMDDSLFAWKIAGHYRYF